MWKRLKTHIQTIDELLSEDSPNTDWNRVLLLHEREIGFFQHERLIHLIVTLAFAIMELACALVTTITGLLAPAALMIAFLLPLVPYVVHYYHLENGTQRLYAQFDRLVERADA